MTDSRFKDKIATVFGGTGFLGRQIVRELANKGARIKVVTRAPERAYFLKPCGVVGQIVPVACDYSEQSINAAVTGSDFVINCVGILFEKGKKRKFERAHVETAAAIAHACAQNKVSRLVHISALGVDKAGSKYAKTKRAGEEAIFAAFPSAAILRPSVIFGEQDEFLNMFARMSMVLPMLPLIGGGKTKFQPVYVGDVAQAAVHAIECPDAPGRVYELGGPEVLTFKQILERMFQYTKRPRMLVTLPFGLAKIQAGFLSMLPRPPLTADQVESLKTDNIVTQGMPGLKDLQVEATPMDLILPIYLTYYRPGGRFGNKKAA